MPRLGRAMADAMIEIGVATPAELRQLGSAESFRRLRFAHGGKITITWIYALDVAITGDSWDDLTPERINRLRTAAEAIIAGAGHSTPRRPKG